MRDRDADLSSFASRLAATGPIPENREKTADRRGRPRRPRKYPGMGTVMANNSTDTVRLLERARAGDPDALNEIFTRYRDRLRRMVALRLDWRLQARIDASDVIQDAYVEVATRLEEYLRDPALPLFLWLRLVVG